MRDPSSHAPRPTPAPKQLSSGSATSCGREGGHTERICEPGQESHGAKGLV
jgi:hypothetical protein